jgi:FAD/FMN-containing dehydrogenase
MRSNVQAIDALLASGERASFGPLPTDSKLADGPEEYRRLVRSMMTLAKRESDEIIRRFPKIHRRVGGYNIDALLQQQPSGPPLNMADLLVGSEGTLAFSTRISLQLQRVPSHKVVGVCHFPTFYQAMDVTQHIVKLNPDAVELVDRTLIELAKDIAIFRDTLDSFIRGTPDAVLLVEFAGEDMELLRNQLNQLVALMGDLGFPDSVVEITDPVMQRAVWELRKAGLNIMMSMKGDGKPVSFIEDCAVPLDNLAEYTHRLTDVFHRQARHHRDLVCARLRRMPSCPADPKYEDGRGRPEDAIHRRRSLCHGAGIQRITLWRTRRRHCSI